MHQFTSVTQVMQFRRRVEMFIILMTLLFSIGGGFLSVWIVNTLDRMDYPTYQSHDYDLKVSYMAEHLEPPPFSPPSDMRWVYSNGYWYLVTDTELDSLYTLFEALDN